LDFDGLQKAPLVGGASLLGNEMTYFLSGVILHSIPFLVREGVRRDRLMPVSFNES
jgi:hypothetical protein